VTLTWCFTALSSAAEFEDLARAGDWRRILDVAVRRDAQLPLNPAEAMIAARAARETGNRQAEVKYLEIATRAEDEQLRRLAEVQLAELLSAVEPGRAVALALPAFDRDHPWQVRALATEVSKSAVNNGIDPGQRAAIEGTMRRLSRSLRRQLELTLALTDTEGGRRRLERLLEASTRDLVALQAAEALSTFDENTPRERWRVARALYQHAMYDRAAPLFENLIDIGDGTIPREDAAFLRGRCAFRRGRWQEAVEWYRKALSWERSLDKKADLEVHIGRCYELAGNLDGAVEAAVRSVRLKTTDDRRLFLARLRLRRGETELAEHGIQRLRSRSNRMRGEVMLAVDALKRGDDGTAQSRLERVRRSPWSVPAAILAAELAARQGDPETALDLLQRLTGSIGDFWVHQARLVMGGLPQERIEAWRLDREQEVKAAADGSLWRALGRWALLEPDPAELRLLRGMIDAAFASFGSDGDPEFSPGLAAGLWATGLEWEAARWDPSGWPRSDAVASAWTAAQFMQHGFPWYSTRVADGAWRQAGSEVPTTMLPLKLRRALYPLPEPVVVREAAATGGVDWSLLAAVAREESRWDPHALSAVGARGLVQLMPATAVAVASSSGLPPPPAEGLFDPGLNLKLGAIELGRLITTFEGRWAPAIAAYNAGEVQAKLWLDQCGPECTSALYLLNISFGSTRTYTAEVLAAAASYQELYEETGASRGERVSD
jgi:soluble lytic murein transglycosylase-like protein/tetratricopeptide (TPR) repeat protein